MGVFRERDVAVVLPEIEDEEPITRAPTSKSLYLATGAFDDGIRAVFSASKSLLQAL